MTKNIQRVVRSLCVGGWVGARLSVNPIFSPFTRNVYIAQRPLGVIWPKDNPLVASTKSLNVQGIKLNYL